jgi:hypothetical protein
MTLHRRSACFRALPKGALIATFLVATAASAEITKSECVDADTQAQQLRRDEKLGATREKLKLCTDPACPALVRDDCAQRLDELDKIQPTLVFEAKDGAGRDLTDVKVTLDDQPLVDTITGAAVPVEPGPHTFKFEAKGEKPITRQLVLREGDKARHEKIVFGSPPPPPVDPSRGAAQRTGGVVAIVLGGAGLGIGGVFGALAASKWSSAQSACATSKTCTTDNHTTATGDKKDALTLASVSTVGFVTGGILATGGIILYVTAPSASREGKPTQGIELVPNAGPGGAGMTLRGWF